MVLLCLLLRLMVKWTHGLEAPKITRQLQKIQWNHEIQRHSPSLPADPTAQGIVEEGHPHIMFTVLKFRKQYFKALGVRPQEMMGWGRGNTPALQNQRTRLLKNRQINSWLSKRGERQCNSSSCCLTWSFREAREEEGKEGLLSPRALEHPYLEANSSTPSKGIP